MDQDKIGGLAAAIIAVLKRIQLVRLGAVTAINGGATPPTLAVDGRTMRFVGVPANYTVGQTVAYWNLGQPFVLGQLY